MLANYCKGNGKYFKGIKKNTIKVKMWSPVDFFLACKGNSFIMHSMEKKENDNQDHNSNQQNFCKISIWNTPFLPSFLILIPSENRKMHK